MPEMMTREEVERLIDRATPGAWMVATSCSYRRIYSEECGDVLWAELQRHDGYPTIADKAGLDSDGTGPNLRLAAAAPDLARSLLAALDRIAELEAANERLAEVIDMHVVVPADAAVKERA